MKPVLVEYAGIPISAYSLLMATGAGLLVWRAAADARRSGLPRRAILWSLLVAWCTGWVGARLFFVVEHRGLLAGNWWTWLAAPSFGGFSSYGGALTAAASAALYARLSGLPVFAMLNSGASGLCLFGVCARLGCFLAGCCHGIPTGAAWGVVFPASAPAALRYGASVAVHPTQLYEAAVLAVLATWLFFTASYRSDGRFVWLAVCYSCARLLLEEFRGDGRPAAHHVLSPAQWISLAVLGAAVCLLLLRKEVDMLKSRYHLAGGIALAIFMGSVLCAQPATGRSGGEAPRAVPVTLRGLTAEPSKYLDQTVQVAGVLENQGKNYFTDLRVVLKDEEGRFLPVRPWLPLSVGPRPPARKATPETGRPAAMLSDYLGKKVELTATVRKGELRRFGDVYHLEVCVARFIR